ncbi:MAG: N-acetylmuramoyl-L-alanine amidase [Oscillospiraceae bacterium]|nr:N-acetylmuramoyl-L-alanine amidase [Oscillospiraceae bacterium]
MARTKRSRKRKGSRILFFAAAVLVLLLAAGLFTRVKSPMAPDASVFAPQPQAPVLHYEGELDSPALLTKAWIYGTHLNLEGQLPLAQAENVLTAQLVLYAADGQEQSWPLFYTGEGEQLRFWLSEHINGGIELETLAEGEGFLLVRVTALTGQTAADGTAVSVQTQHPLAADGTADSLPGEYYTVTKNGANRRIALTAQPLQLAGGAQPGIFLRCEAAPLPKQVYDIVIDAGHGGTDAGSLSPDGKHYEKDIVLAIALKTRDALQAQGYKVLLTRDGTEDPKTKMAYTMYDADGRVTRTVASGAKLCLSLHLNSYDGHLRDGQGGVQIYAADAMDYTFARSLSQSIADAAGSYPSTMDYYNVAPGVFCRTFTQSDSDELAAEGYEFNFEPYDIPAGTNYYYIIRETGCSVTGAYIDGRHPHYGENIYRGSRTGVETYLCELGYINLQEDLDTLLNSPESYAAGIAAAVQARFGG